MKALIKNTFLMMMLGIGCASAQNKKTVALGEITKLEISSKLDVVLFQSTENKMEVPDDDNVKFEEIGNTLSLSFKKNYEGETPQVKVHLKTISAIELAGLVNLTSEGVFKTEKLRIQVAGASNADLNLELNDLKTELVGASNFTLKGKCNKFEVDIAGASKLNAFNFETNETEVDATGASQFKVWAKDKIDASAAGASKGEYKGNPKLREINITGASKINNLDGENEIATTVLGDDTLKIKLGDKRITIMEELKIKKKKHHEPKGMKHVWSGFELGVETFTTPDLKQISAPHDFLNPQIGKSWFFGLNFLEHDVQLVKRHLSLATGLGIDAQIFSFDGDRYIKPNSSTMIADTSKIKLNTNRWVTANISAPFLIKYNSGTTKGSRNRFHFATGVIVSYSFEPSITMVSTANGYKTETELTDDFNYNPFRVTATVRVGYGWLRLFANYGLTPVFDTGKSPDVRICAAGLTVFPF